MGIHLKDMIYGVCQKAIKAEQDENGENIVKLYQKKLGCGYFTGNIDYINKNSIFYCDASNEELSGHLPITNARDYEFFLKTDFVEEGTQSSQKMQTAIMFKSGVHKKFIRSGDEGGYSLWAEILTSNTLKDFYIEVDSEDISNPTEWTNFKTVQNFVSGKLSELFTNISIMSKNLKYLRKLIGTTDISKLADGTLTGIVNSLNTDIRYKYIGNEITLLENIYLYAYVENGMVIIRSIVPTSLSVGLRELMRVPEKYAPREVFFGYVSYNSSSSDINKVSSVLITGEGSVKVWLLSELTHDEPFTIMYPLKRS